MFPPADFDHLSSAELKSLVLKLLEEVAVPNKQNPTLHVAADEVIE
jgi:hypothetical protein